MNFEENPLNAGDIGYCPLKENQFNYLKKYFQHIDK